jgi:hypothetical protein
LKIFKMAKTAGLKLSQDETLQNETSNKFQSGVEALNVPRYFRKS